MDHPLQIRIAIVNEMMKPYFSEWYLIGDWVSSALYDSPIYIKHAICEIVEGLRLKSGPAA